MIPRLLLAVLFTLFTLSNLYAQHATINGQIKNITGNPLTGATVILYYWLKQALQITTEILKLARLNQGNIFYATIL